MRALVVVPMQIFSYRPGPTLRTFGAVWRRNAPLRSIGGSIPWSKIRICVRSRIPMMWPWATTSSPARSFRISAGSVTGNVTSCRAISASPRSRRSGALLARAPAVPHPGWGSLPPPSLPILRPRCPPECADSGPARPQDAVRVRGPWSRVPVEVDGAVGGDVRGGAARRPALVVHRNGVQGHVRVGVLDVALEHGDVAAEAHRADPRLVEELVQLVLELRDERVGVPRADRPRDRLLREVHRVVGRAADADPDDPRRAGLPAGADDRLEHELLDPGDPVGGHEHLEEGHVLGAGSLRAALHVEPVPVRHEVPVDDRDPEADVRSRVLARERVHGVGPQRVLDRRALRARLERRVDAGRMQREVLADAAVVDGDPRVLADEVLLLVRDLDVAVDRLEDPDPGHGRLAVSRGGEGVTEVLRDVLQRPDVEMRRRILDRLGEIGARDGRHAFAFVAALAPARRPTTPHSRRLLPIMRFLPWVPPAISPHA